MLKTARGIFKRALTLSLCVATCNVAHAQSASSPDDFVIQEIVVTAEKRAESVQKVPISIDAFDGSALQARAVGSVSELSAISPNVNLDSGVSFTSSTAVLAASIRGIGASDFALNIDPAVGIYVDGIYLARSVGANQDLLDVERLEILKGPQGTLFGRNTIGGAINVITRDPAKEFAVQGDITTGSFNRMQARGSIDIPLTSNLFSSITADVDSRNGYMERLPFPDALAYNSRPFTAYPAAGYNSDQTEGGEDNRILRGKLKYENGGFTSTFAADYEYADGVAPTTLLQTTENIPGTFANLYNTCIGLAPAALQTIGLLNACSSSGTQYPSQHGATTTPVARLPGIAGADVGGNPSTYLLPYNSGFITHNPDTSYANGNDFSHLTDWGLTNNAQLELNDSMTLKSITGYRRSRWTSGQDGDGSPINMATYSFYQRQEQLSQEFQLVGNMFDRKLNYVLGAYYFRESGFLDDFVMSGEGLYIIDGPNWLDTSNEAAFGQLDFRPTQLLGFTAGGRFTHEDKSFEGGQQELNGLFYKLAGSPCSDVDGNIYPYAVLPTGQTCRQANNYPTDSNPLRIYPPGVNHLSFNNFSPKLGMQLHPSDDLMFYASWSRGYKTGGWTTRYSTPQVVVSSFNPETATTYEVGFKSEVFDHKLQVNGAIFYTDFNGIQLNYQVGGSPTIANVGNGQIKGSELEIVARPTRILSVNFGAGYTDAYYTSLNPAVAVVSGPNALEAGAIVGGPLPKSPKFKVNVGPTIDMPLGNGGTLSLAGDYTYTSSMANDVERTYALIRPAVGTINSSLVYRSPSNHYTLTVGGTNITDRRYIISGNSIPAFGAIVGTYSRPAEWYARLGYKF